jgi:hypothetical protein
MAPGGKPKKDKAAQSSDAQETPEQVAPVAVADQEHAPEGSPPDAPASSLKRTAAEAVDENRMMTYFKRIKSGAAKKASEGEVQQATQALDVFKDLQPTQRGAFVKLFLDSKASKDFGFVKEYAEELVTSQEHKETITENYLTRIDMYAQL